MKKIDLYIIRKFLGTFFFSIAIIVSIAMVFDLSEKIDDFLEKDAPVKEIIFTYYLNFIPYFANLFSPLFTFIAVIFFTSKMASQTEIVAILSSGVSFNRMLRPYIMAATVIAILSFFLNNYVIPPANAKRVDFENRYVRNKFWNGDINIHRQVKPGEFLYFNNFNAWENIGYQFSYEKFEKGKLTYKIMADVARWDTVKKLWHCENYHQRFISGYREFLTSGPVKDTLFPFDVKEFNSRDVDITSLDLNELNAFIEQEKMKGSEDIPFYEVEKYQRIAYPCATFILTLIGVAMSSRKVRGGIGFHIGMGLLLSFSFILFMQVATTFATNSNVPAYIAVFIPHLLYLPLGFYLLKIAPK